MAVSKTLRYAVMERDGFTCQYCGVSALAAELQVDHVMPVSCGGQDTPENLLTACKECNAGKSSSLPRKPLDNRDLSRQAVELEERAALLARIRAAGRAIGEDLHGEALDLLNFWGSLHSWAIEREKPRHGERAVWFACLRRLLTLHTADEIEEAILLAHFRLKTGEHEDYAKYTQGILRRKRIEIEREEAAREKAQAG
ncbi:hypothetical protein LCGC14_1675530 [marine sediment metagenome]|uniref:HNH nuclease domain-containing protein n=1 Tax=marine sediment metagenome TaxID=412755 RepID=A0A0F9ICI6_9ZZZZ